MGNVLIGCETSGRIREAFRKAGHNAWSCDLLPAKDDSPFHIQGDVRNELQPGRWDLFIVHPDCTYLTGSAAWAFGDGPYHQKVKPGTLVGQARRDARNEALDFVREMMAADVPRIALENPVGAIGTNIDAREYGFSSQKASQYIQPFEFGDDASKKTGLWLKNLPPLKPTQKIEPRWICCGEEIEDVVRGCPFCGGVNRPAPRWGNQTDSGQNRLSPGADRWQIRSETYQGWADAMAEQWGKLI